MEEKIVDNWRIILSGDEYTAPERRRFHLQGIALWKDDGLDRITTSPIVGSEDNGQVMVTRSGSRYKLGQPASGPDSSNPLKENVRCFFGISFEECCRCCPMIPLK